MSSETGSFSRQLRAQAQSLPEPWHALTTTFFESTDGAALCSFIDDRIQAGVRLFPSRPLHALELTPFKSVRVVILGQDPYHGAGQAQGLAFSVPPGLRLPPSLRNILLELEGDLGIASRCGDLSRWAQAGVLMLNTVLTVEEGRPASHAGRGWERLTDRIIGALARDAAPKAFLLWGAHAQVKEPMIAVTGARHLVLRANHPSPLSARRPPLPFIGCRHFSQANAFLASQGRAAIDWRL